MAYNRKLLNMQEKKKHMFFCRKQESPANGKCLTENLIYKVTVKTKNHIKFYVGSTRRSFKNSYTKHTYSFKHEMHCSATTLSKLKKKLTITFIGKF